MLSCGKTMYLSSFERFLKNKIQPLVPVSSQGSGAGTSGCDQDGTEFRTPTPKPSLPFVLRVVNTLLAHIPKFAV